MDTADEDIHWLNVRITVETRANVGLTLAHPLLCDLYQGVIMSHEYEIYLQVPVLYH